LVTPTAAPDAGLAKEPGSTVSIYRSMAESKGNSQQARAQRDSYTNSFLSDLALIDVASGKAQRLARRQKLRWYGFSPDGARVAFTTAKGLASDKEFQGLYDLWVAPVASGEARTVATDIPMVGGESVSWSPDGRWLAYITYGDLAQGDCFLAAADEQSPPRLLTPSAHPNFGHELRAPLWSGDGSTLYLLSPSALWRASVMDGAAREFVKIPGHQLLEAVAPNGGGGRFWSPDAGKSLVLMTRDDQQLSDGFFRVELATGTVTRLVEERKSYGPLFPTSPMVRIDVSANGRRMIFAAQSAQQSEDLWLVENGDFHTSRRVTDINPQITRYVMGESRVIEWRTADGQKLRGALLLPAGYKEGHRYPLIVFQYPGDMMSRYANNYGLGRYGSAMENWQLLATRGYAVLLPDVPRKVGTAMQDIAKAVLPGVDKVIELGIADPDRLGVMGHSFGGYGVLCLLVQTTRFKAAVERAGPANLISAYSQLQPNGSSLYTGQIEAASTGGTLWEKRDTFIENSPVFFLDRVRTPLLIIQGSADPGTSAFLTDELFVCLRRLGREVEYAKYEGEGHAEDAWQYANQVDYLKRMIGWFDAKLRPAQR
jgi:dipeptidyl aminopeptidase/acylaminoacyl peptidase